MEPANLVLLCMVAIVSIFGLIHLLKKSPKDRAREIHNKSTQKALKNEVYCLHRMLKQILTYKRFDLHEKVHISNMESIKYLNYRINEIIFKKTKIIENYAFISAKEIQAFMQNSLTKEKQAVYHELNIENDKIIASLDKDIIQLQSRRALQWKSELESRNYLEEQEILRNNYINSLYKRYRALLEKIYINIDNNNVNPLIINFFKPSLSINEAHTNAEKNRRINIKNIELMLNKNTYNLDKNIDLMTGNSYSVEHA